jgi:hypothetical protein
MQVLRRNKESLLPWADSVSELPLSFRATFGIMLSLNQLLHVVILSL